MKFFSVYAFFPEIRPAHRAWESCTVKASTLSAAVSRGLRTIRPRLKGKRITEARITVKMFDGTQSPESD